MFDVVELFFVEVEPFFENEVDAWGAFVVVVDVVEPFFAEVVPCPEDEVAFIEVDGFARVVEDVVVMVLAMMQEQAL